MQDADHSKSLDDKEAQTSSLEDATIGLLIDRMAIPSFVINKAHVVTHWNLALAKATGLSKERMVGTRDQWRPFYGGPRPTMADLIIEGEVNGEVERFYQDKYKKSDLVNGAYVAEDFFPDVGSDGEWMSFSASPIHDSVGEVIGAIETLVFITDRKRAEFELVAREQRYRELSTIDDLTQLYNSRHFYGELSKELGRVRRYKQPLSICMLDLDYFKQLNDTHGHLFGDQVLERVGQLIQNHLRSADSGYRYGGEEFVILMPQADADDALIALERIRTELEAMTFVSDTGEAMGVTLSAGIATFCKGDNDKALVHRADLAMYRAKEAGRNRIVVCSDEV